MKKLKMTTQSLTFEEGCNKYLENCRRRNLREGTIGHYRQSYTQFYSFMMSLAEEQIKAAFDQAEKEVTDLHSRISQGIREANKNGIKIDLTKGTSLTTKKSIECKAIIRKHSKDFGGSLDDPDVIKLCGCSRNSYYKYKREVKT